MASNAFKEVIAGAIGVWTLDRLDWFLYRHEGRKATRRIEAIRPGGMDPAHAAANKAASVLGRKLHPAQPHPAGVGIRYALGIGPAAIYGALREQLPVERQGQDYLYGFGLGLALFLIQDEGLNQAMGLLGKQKDYLWQAHARGLAAHLTLGLAANLMLNVLNASRPMPRTAAAPRHAHPLQQENDFLPMAFTDKSEEPRTALH